MEPALIMFLQLTVVGRLGVLTVSAAALADQEVGRQDDAHAPIQLLHMVADRAEDILNRPDDAEAEFHVKGVRLKLFYFFDVTSKFL